VRRVLVQTGAEMLQACLAALPADAAVLAAAVGDFRPPTVASGKLKKRPGQPPAPIELVETQDILATLSALPAGRRPALVVGFAAETPADPEELLAEAQAKRARKRCDWLVANDVGAGSDIMGGDENAVLLLTAGAPERWPRLPKPEVGRRLAARIAAHLAHPSDTPHMEEPRS
jgi:phosphopantothenoylcysteine decarboxylase / phosphopantothenate---cysteine ligase